MKSYEIIGLDWLASSYTGFGDLDRVVLNFTHLISGVVIGAGYTMEALHLGTKRVGFRCSSAAVLSRVRAYLSNYGLDVREL